MAWVLGSSQGQGIGKGNGLSRGFRARSPALDEG
jgi:hypothetical protein